MKKAAKILFILLTTAVLVSFVAIKLNDTYIFKMIEQNEASTTLKDFVQIKGENGEYRYIITQDGVMLLKYSGEEENVTVPDEIEGYSVFKIKNSCFAGNEKIKSVSLPKTLKYIDNFAFYNCGNLSEIKLNDGLLIIGDSAFRKTAAESVEIPTSVVYIGIASFMNCDSLENVVFHNNISLKIGMCAFSGTAIKQISVPKGTYEIEKSAFAKCKKLEMINIPEEADVSIKGIADYGVKIITK